MNLHSSPDYGFFLFAWVFLEQLGLPIPAAPLLLVAGDHAHAGHVPLSVVAGATLAGALTADLLWYYIGRSRGSRIMALLCRISLQPDSCSRRTQQFFAKYGRAVLVVAKFLPGINAAAAPMSGVFHMRMSRFLVLDVAGIVLWATTFIGVGYLFAENVQVVLATVERIGLARIGPALFFVLAAWVLGKYAKRRTFSAQLMAARRITAEELKQQIDRGEPVTILDVRHPLDLYSSPRVIPGAIRIPLEQLEARRTEVPRNHEIVVYCTCPNEASSVKAAMLFQHLGITSVRVLAGGFQTWEDRHFPVEPFDFTRSAGVPEPLWAF